MSELSLRLEPFGADRFKIVIIGSQSFEGNHALCGPSGKGYTEADLRDPQGLPKLGLSDERIDQEIASANARRAANAC